MINIKEVSNKLSEILNDTNNPLRIDNERVLFLVATQGYRIESIYDRHEGKNAIPVFIALSGGENNPIPNLKQTSKSMQVAIYYPIIYKDLFYDLENYLYDKFVGKMVDFGTLSGSCLTNMGVAEYGEIQQMDLQQFTQWAGNTYNKTFNITSNWFSMSFTLYATSLSSGFMFGNDVSYEMKLKYNEFNISIDIEVVGAETKTYTRYKAGDEGIYYAWKNGAFIYYTDIDPDTLYGKLIYLNGQVKTTYNSAFSEEGEIVKVNKINTINEIELTESLVWSSSGTGASVSPIAQQIIGKDGFSKNVANITSFNKSMSFYLNPNTEFGEALITFYNTQRLDMISDIILSKTYSNGFTFDFRQLTLTLNENIELGSPLSFTITLGDKK